jgi:L-ascorbate metabolism protein UlaG (beta-lactamase superfamily)
MKLTWLGHSGFRIEIADQTLLVDPWFSGNPMFPEDRRAEATAGVTAILVSHGHADHAHDAPSLARELKAPTVGTYDLMSWWEKTHGISVVGFNKGGTIRLGAVAVTLVNAVHSSSVGGENGPVYAGCEAGFMIEGEGRTVYFSGDTDATADMEVFQALHRPEIGILSAGGHFTMDMRRAAWAAKRYFDFRTVIPCHYRTFPILEQSAAALRDGLPGVDVIEPEVLVPIEL